MYLSWLTSLGHAHCSLRLQSVVSFYFLSTSSWPRKPQNHQSLASLCGWSWLYVDVDECLCANQDKWRLNYPQLPKTLMKEERDLEESTSWFSSNSRFFVLVYRSLGHAGKVVAVRSVIFLIFMIYIEGSAFLGTIVTFLLLRFQDNVALMRRKFSSFQ